MTDSTSDVYVWVWLPGQPEPVPAGVLRRSATGLSFRYGRHYLERSDSIDLYGLPRNNRWHPAVNGLSMPASLRDAAPDAWGMRVILDRVLGTRGAASDVDSLDQSVYLLESASDRIGAVDFQRSPVEYDERGSSASIEQMQQAARALDDRQELTPELRAALQSGTGIGGARPKATLTQDGRHFIAKFSVGSDSFSVIGAEAVSLNLARAAGIPVPESRVVRVAGRDVLLTERFDRLPAGRRRLMVSGLTMLGLGEMESRYGTYVDLVDVLRQSNADPYVGRKVFTRVAFNIAISNTDDHLRNHAAFWDGQRLELTPAYDLSPSARSGDTVSQAIGYSRAGDRIAGFATLISASAEYDLSRTAGAAIVEDLVESIHRNWEQAADEARLTSTDRSYLWGRQILNPAASYDVP